MKIEIDEIKRTQFRKGDIVVIRPNEDAKFTDEVIKEFSEILQEVKEKYELTILVMQHCNLEIMSPEPETEDGKAVAVEVKKVG